MLVCFLYQFEGTRELTRWFWSTHSHKWIKSKNSLGQNGTLGTFQLVCQFFIYLEGSSNLEKVLLLCFSLYVSLCLKMLCLHFIFSSYIVGKYKNKNAVFRYEKYQSMIVYTLKKLGILHFSALLLYAYATFTFIYFPLHGSQPCHGEGPCIIQWSYEP